MPLPVIRPNGCVEGTGTYDSRGERLVTAAEVGLRVLEVTAILLPLMGIFTQIFMGRIARDDSAWGERQIQMAYALIGVTTISIVLAGATAILPFLAGPNPIEILVPLSALYVGYWGIGMTIAAVTAAALRADSDAEGSLEQVLLSAWSPTSEVKTDEY